jgi:hypothetical protein
MSGGFASRSIRPIRFLEPRLSTTGNRQRRRFATSLGCDQWWDMETGRVVQTLRAPRPYEGMNIAGTTGITEAQRTTLKALGAVER